MTIKPFTISPKLPSNPQLELQQLQERVKLLQRQAELHLMQVDAGVGGAPSRILVALLSPNPRASRTYITQEAVDMLAQSIAQYGLLQPILVRNHPDEPGEYQIIVGGLRWLAAKQLGHESIPAVVIEATDSQMGIFSLRENMGRAQYTASELRAAKKCVEDNERSQQQRNAG